MRTLMRWRSEPVQAPAASGKLHGHIMRSNWPTQRSAKLQAGQGPGRRLRGGASAAGLPLTPAARLPQARTCRRWRRRCSPGAGPGRPAPAPQGSRALAWGGGVSHDEHDHLLRKIKPCHTQRRQRGTCEFLLDLFKARAARSRHLVTDSRLQLRSNASGCACEAYPPYAPSVRLSVVEELGAVR